MTTTANVDYTLTTLNKYNDRYLFRVYYTGAEWGDARATSEFFTVTDWASDEELLKAYDRAVARFAEIGVREKYEDADEDNAAFALNLQKEIGGNVTAQETKRLYLAT